MPLSIVHPEQVQILPAAPQDQCLDPEAHPRAGQALSPHLVEDIRHVLLAAGLLGVAQLGRVPAGQQALVPHQGHALVGHLVPLKVHLVVRTTCRRRAWLKIPGSPRLITQAPAGMRAPSHNSSREETLPENPAQG